MIVEGEILCRRKEVRVERRKEIFIICSLDGG
jgi:hypothetical protein